MPAGARCIGDSSRHLRYSEYGSARFSGLRNSSSIGERNASRSACVISAIRLTSAPSMEDAGPDRKGRNRMTDVKTDVVLYDVADGIATLTLNRPERNNAW